MYLTKAALASAIAQLKNGLGNNWSTVTAIQFMFGRRAEFAADCATPEERPRLYLAHIVAKQICSDDGYSHAVPPDGIDAAKFISKLL